MIAERMRMEYPPMRPSDTAVSGSTRWWSRSSRYGIGSVGPPDVVIPDVGNHPRPAAKMMINGMPMTKYGIEYRIRPIPLPVLSKVEPRLQPA